MSSEEELDINVLKADALLHEAQRLMRDIMELLGQCKSARPSSQRHCNTATQQRCQGVIEEDGDTLIIEGFRFESAASWEDLNRLGSQSAAAGHNGNI